VKFLLDQEFFDAVLDLAIRVSDAFEEMLQQE